MAAPHPARSGPSAAASAPAGSSSAECCRTPSTVRPGGPGRGPCPARHRSPLPLLLLPDGAQIDATGRLSIAGVDLLDLCQTIGTPAFVYDEEHLRRRCREAVGAWGDGVAYASKAFLCRAMARLAYEEGMAIDVSTGGELHVALAAGVPGSGSSSMATTSRTPS